MARSRGQAGDRDRRVERDRRRDARGAAERRARASCTGSRRDGNLDVDGPRVERARSSSAALAELGGLDILVNNAGLSRGRDPVWDSLEEDEREVIETNVLGLMRMTRLCVPALDRSGGGHIVNLGSVAGIWAYPNGSSYVASKFAVHGYTRALRDDLHGKPVRVTNVAPASSRRTSRTCASRRRAEGGRRLFERRDSAGRCTPRMSPTASCSRSRGRRTSTSTRSSCWRSRRRPARTSSATSDVALAAPCPSSGAGRATTARTARRGRSRLRRRPTIGARGGDELVLRPARRARARPSGRARARGGRDARRRRRGRRNGSARADPARARGSRSIVACQASTSMSGGGRDGQDVARAAGCARRRRRRRAASRRGSS